MLKMFTTHEVELMRRDAKQKACAAGVPLSKAQDQIAAEHGYRNWSLLQKNGCMPADQPQPYLFRRTAEEVAQAMRVLAEPRSRRISARPANLARETVLALDSKFVSAANAVDFAIAYMDSVLARPRYLVNSKMVAYWEMRLWLPYGAEPIKDDLFILVNRHYKPQGSTSTAFADYENYPHLCLRLAPDEWRQFSHPKTEQPFLFNDGSRPWLDRACAEQYLERLKRLREVC